MVKGEDPNSPTTQPLSLKAIHLPKERILQSEDTWEGTFIFKANHEMQDARI